MIEYKTIGYIAIGLIAIYFAVRIAGQMAIRKLIRAEFDHVVNSDEHKVKGRFG